MADHAIADAVILRVTPHNHWLPQLVKAAATIGGMDLTELVAPGRIGFNVRLRSAIVLAAVDILGKRWNEIGRALGGRNHGSMIHAYQSAKRRIEHDVEFQTLCCSINFVAAAIANRPVERSIEPERTL